MTDRLRTLQTRLDAWARSPVVLLYAGGCLLLVFSGWLWWAKVYTSPRAVFDGMLANNLKTSAFTEHQMSQDANGLRIDKTSQVSFGTTNQIKIAAATTATATNTTVRTETVATPRQEFNRYRSITAGRGQTPDLSVVVNRWAEGTDQTGSTAFVQNLLQPYRFPMANLPAALRHDLTARLRQDVVFETDYEVQRSVLANRPVYTYRVSIRPVAYIAFIKAYAAGLGLRELDEVEPNQAEGAPSIPVTVTVDVRSHRLVKVEYPELGYTNTYREYNVIRPKSSLPQASLSAERLRELVSGVR